MKAKIVEAWVWVLIYGGLLSACLGYFVDGKDPKLGWQLVAGGAVAVVSGLVLIVLRSRMRP